VTSTPAPEGRPVVGLIGLGVMGRPIAGRIAAAGFDVVALARTPASAEAVARSAARIVSEPAHVADAADVILLALPDVAAVEAVVLDGLIATGRLRAGTTVVDLSTIEPGAARRIGTAIESAGGRALDAPMSGGESGAIEGTLSLMVGGDPAVLEAARPVLAAFATTIVHVGPLGAGQVAKACNQLVVLGTLELVAEALALASAAGVDPAAVRMAMIGGLVGSRLLASGSQRMLSKDYAPGGRLRFHAKDIAAVRALAGPAGLTLPAFEAAAAAATARLDAGDGDLDHAVIGRHVLLDTDDGPAAATTITFASDDRTRLYHLPGREWALLLGPQNSPSRRMTMSLATFPPGSAPGLHVHRLEDEVVHVLAGRGRLEAERGGGPIEPGAAFHVPAGLWHGAVNDGSEPLVLLCVFSPPVTPGAYDPLPPD
jgi:2-hydroxy-3-oxopropionate reductase